MAAVLKQPLNIPTVGALIDELTRIRSDLEELAEQEAALKREKTEVEGLLLAAMDAQGVTSLRGSKATVSVSEKMLAQVEDWEKVYQFIKRTGSWQLMERRIAHAAFRELLDTRGTPIPGLGSFTKRSINFRSL